MMGVTEKEYVATISAFQERLDAMENRLKVSEAARRGLKKAIRKDRKEEKTPPVVKEEGSSSFLKWLISD